MVCQATLTSDTPKTSTWLRVMKDCILSSLGCFGVVGSPFTFWKMRRIVKPFFFGKFVVKSSGIEQFGVEIPAVLVVCGWGELNDVAGILRGCDVCVVCNVGGKITLLAIIVFIENVDTWGAGGKEDVCMVLLVSSSSDS